METAVLTAEDRKAVLEAALSDPATYASAGESVAELRSELETITARIESLYARWQELESLRGGQ